jgi:hypothetical protein
MVTERQLYRYIEKYGITKVKIEKDLIIQHNIQIPKGTILYFGIIGRYISTFDGCTEKKNRKFNYDFDYIFTIPWHYQNITFTILED